MGPRHEARDPTCWLAEGPRGQSKGQTDQEGIGERPHSLEKSSVVAVPYKPRLTVGDAVTELGSLGVPLWHSGLRI